MRILIAAFLAITIMSCGKSNQDATVSRDCSGTYLTIDSKDFKVCNEELLEGYEEGVKLKASFSKLKNGCPYLENKITCELYHEYKYWIEIKKIKVLTDL
jgi:hypothetical protein